MGIKLKGKNSLSKNFSIYIQQKRVHGTLQKFKIFYNYINVIISFILPSSVIQNPNLCLVLQNPINSN